MNALQALILGLVQGLTEFIPVSSSGHLVLVPWLFGWNEMDPALVLPFDTMVHLGTLVAVLAVFWRDFVTLAIAWLASIRQRSLAVPRAKAAWALVIGSVPAAVLGILAEDLFESLFHAPVWAAAFLLVTAGLLWAGERWVAQPLALENLGGRHALFIGAFQALAIAPGISRSGATISAGRFLGMNRSEAARFSFLLATPVIAGAGLLQLVKLADAGGLGSHTSAMLIGFTASLVSGYLVIRLLLRYLQRHSLLPFAAYCAAVGLLGLIVALVR